MRKYFFTHLFTRVQSVIILLLVIIFSNLTIAESLISLHCEGKQYTSVWNQGKVQPERTDSITITLLIKMEESKLLINGGFWGCFFQTDMKNELNNSDLGFCDEMPVRISENKINYIYKAVVNKIETTRRIVLDRVDGALVMSSHITSDINPLTSNHVISELQCKKQEKMLF